MLYSRCWTLPLAVLSMLFLLTGCGGGGGGSSAGLPNTGDLQISASSVTFEAEIGGATPSTSFLSVSFSDSRIYDVVVGVPSGSSLPSWLGINLTGNSSPMTLSVSINTTNLSTGTYSATLRVATRYLTQNGITVLDARDIPVTYNVYPNITVSATPNPLGLTRNEPATAQAQSVIVTFSGGTPASWAPSVSYVSGNGWLSVTQTGNTLNVQPSNLAPGQYQASIQINYMTGTLMKSSAIPVTYTVNSAISAPGNINFTINGDSTAGAQSQTITIGANTAGGANPNMNWSASVNQPWLSLSPASGVTGSSNNLTLNLVTSELLKLANGSYQATLTITASDPALAPRLVPVILTINLPSVSYVAPYIATAGVAGTAIVRGSGFNSVTSPVVKIGTATAASVTRINDTELRISYDAITNTSYPYAQSVYVENALGLQKTRAQLVTVAASSFAAERIASTGSKTNVIYNGERKDIYVGNLTDGTLERYRHNGSSWAKTTLALPGIKYSPTDAIIISPDGKLIATFDDNHIYLVNLDTFTLSKTVTFAPRFANWLGTIAFTNNGKILAADSNQWSDIQVYDVLTDTTTNQGYGWIWGPMVLSSIDGSRVLVSAGSSTASIYDASTSAYLTATGALGTMPRSANLGATRFITQYNTDFYAIYNYGSNLPLSSLSTLNHSIPAMNRSGNSFFLHDGSLKQVQRYDASNATLQNSVSVADVLSSGRVTLSEDEATLFIATNQEIKILPAP